ncbi:MAG: hypothetical protein PHW42_04720 [Patescibacteria group bacterium]|nr:hypothetical protein [Patescibacteria group bacterium]MDD4695717.1 hypothetical protein [Patescibacteria group bacterium]
MEVNAMCFDWRVIGIDARARFGMGKQLDTIPNVPKDPIKIVTELGQLLTYSVTRNVKPDLFIDELQCLDSEEAIEHANALNRKLNAIFCSAHGILKTEDIPVFVLVSHKPDHDLKPKFLFNHNGLLLREREIIKIIEVEQRKTG